MAGINLKIKNGSREKFRVGIIGTGNIARHHVKTYLTFENVEIVALCDIIPGKAEAFARQFGLDSARVPITNIAFARITSIIATRSSLS